MIEGVKCIPSVTRNQICSLTLGTMEYRLRWTLYGFPYRSSREVGFPGNIEVWLSMVDDDEGFDGQQIAWLHQINVIFIPTSHNKQCQRTHRQQRTAR